MIEKNIEISMLFDFYGSLLTEKQAEMLELYYNQDFSLAEVAEIFQISRQAVYDTLKRTEKLLREYEDKLHLLQQAEQRERKTAAALAELTELEGLLTGQTDILDRLRAIRRLLSEEEV